MLASQGSGPQLSSPPFGPWLKAALKCPTAATARCQAVEDERSDLALILYGSEGCSKLACSKHMYQSLASVLFGFVEQRSTLKFTRVRSEYEQRCLEPFPVLSFLTASLHVYRSEELKGTRKRTTWKTLLKALLLRWETGSARDQSYIHISPWNITTSHLF